LQKRLDDGSLAIDKMDPNYKEGMPLVKDEYASERRKAKILNFSLAYGKTEYGLSKDFGVALSEAKDTVTRWYRSRPEVRCRLLPSPPTVVSTWIPSIWMTRLPSFVLLSNWVRFLACPVYVSTCGCEAYGKRVGSEVAGEGA
jgi:hypothetical protein